MEPTTIMAAASVAQGVMGFKGNRAAAKQAQQVAEYNAQVQENELILTQRARREQEAVLRSEAHRLMGTQRVMTAASGIQMPGSPMQALADTYFSMERDAQRVQYASSVEAAQSTAAAAMSRLNGQAQAAAFRAASLGSILGAVSGYASSAQAQRSYELQVSSYERQLD
jgi:hypothetical protein